MMDKYLFRLYKMPAICFVFFLVSCSNQPDSLADLTLTDSLESGEAEIDFAMPTTALPVTPFDKLPAPFYLDSINLSESVGFEVDSVYIEGTDYFLTGYFPQSGKADHTKFNQITQQLVEAFLLDFKLETDRTIQSVEAEIWVTEFYCLEEIISVGFTYQSYTHLAAHFNHGYKTINFDFHTNEPFFLTDVLHFSGETEIQEFCNALNADPFFEWVDDDLVPADFSEDCSFTMAEEGITLWFDDYEKGPSMTSFFIPYLKIREYINPEFTNVFE